MIIAVDTGGTKTLVAVFDDAMSIVDSIKFPTPHDYDEFTAALRQAAANLPLTQVTHGAIGTRGIVDRSAGTLVQDNILGWHDKPFVRDCVEIFGCPFVIENDSKLAGLSEARAASRDYRKVVYVTVSTGIGSTLVIDGQLDADTIDSEVGKWVFEKDGQVRLWEEFASGSWIKDTYGKLASELEDPDAWTAIAHNLALGFVNICAAYTPDLIIVGGGVGNHFEKFADKLQEQMAAIGHPMVKRCPIIKASYPEQAVIYGCYHHARDAAAA